MKGKRLRVDKGLGRICDFYSALGLESVFRRGLGLGIGSKKYRLRLIKIGARVILEGLPLARGLYINLGRSPSTARYPVVAPTARP